MLSLIRLGRFVNNWSRVPMLAIVFIGLALLVRDGLLLVISVSVGLAAVGFGLSKLLMGGGGG